MVDRRTLVQDFLIGTQWADGAMVPIAGDASARRYFRLTSDDLSAIVMDSPPNVQDIVPFLNIARFLQENALSAPKIHKSDGALGLILMEDLGDTLFARITSSSPAMEPELYQAAIDVLATLDQLEPSGTMQMFDAQTMAQQTDLVCQWYGNDMRGFEKISGALETVLESIPRRSILLRDFHAENLIWLPDRDGDARVGLLDFQDAMIGPAGYDLVSLLQDARRDVTQDTTRAMIERFVERTEQDPDRFAANYAALGAQRNLRILGIFARLCLRDGKPRYVDFIPRVWGYVQECLAHPSLRDLRKVIEAELPVPTPAFLQGLKDRCGTIQDQ